MSRTIILLLMTIPFNLTAQVNGLFFDGIVLKNEMTFVNMTRTIEGKKVASFDAILINGREVRAPLSDTIVVNLLKYGVASKDSVHVIVKGDAANRVRIADARSFILQFKAVADTIYCEDQSKLVFKTTSEDGRFHFVLQQFRWNKWVSMKTFMNKGPVSNFYSIDLSLYMHSGQNQFRIMAGELTDGVFYSKSASFISRVPEVTVMKDAGRITFSASTQFEIYDMYGTLMVRGAADRIPLAPLPNGDYFLCYDNKIMEFIKP